MTLTGEWPRGAGPDGFAGPRAARPAAALARQPCAALRAAAGLQEGIQALIK